MRSIKEVFEIIKSEDPDTALTLSGLRSLVNSGKIPTVRIGRKILISYESVIEYLKNPTENIRKENYGVVRQVI